MALMKVMYENHIDAFVHAENTVPTPKLLGPNVGTTSLDGITPFFQIPKIVVPAGFTEVEVAPVFALNPAEPNYTSVLPPAAKQTPWSTRCRSRSRSLPGRARSPRSSRSGRRTSRRRTIASHRRRLARLPKSN